MATQETPAQDAAPEVTETPTTPETPEQDSAVEVGKDGKEFDAARAQALIEKLQNENKTLKPKAKRAEELEAEAQKRADAELSETERLKKQADAATAENAQLKTTIMRQEVIAETGLPAIFTDRLKGATKEEMLADAQELAKTLPTVKIAPKVAPTNPANATNEDTEAQLRAQLFGSPGRLDAETIARLGGGVVMNGKPLTKE